MGGLPHIVLVPALAHGHMIPTLDMAKLFASRGLRTTIITTPSFAHSIEKARESGHGIGSSIINFPPEKSSLPENIESIDQALSTPDSIATFLEAMRLLQEPVEKLLRELKPTCLVSDTFFPWTADSAAKLGIPRLIFNGMSCFVFCVEEKMSIHKPYKNVSSDSEPFVLRGAGLPHELTFVRTQLAPHHADERDNAFSRLWELIRESERKSYGVIINSFYELESAYYDHYKNVMNRKAWHVGPLHLCNNNRGGEIEKECSSECLAWLDSKKPDSVVYVCFGSVASFTRAQEHETAAGLEASGQDFIWVVRRGQKSIEEGGTNEHTSWLPQGFEESIKGRGLIVRGWAPQVTILDHPSVGAFVTHCGWNSILEGICAGVPMVTWPVLAEQFFNEKMVTDVLGIGVPVGNKKWALVGSQGVGREAVETAVRGIMVGEAAEEMRGRAKCYKETARRAVGKGGSSYRCLDDLIDELSVYGPTMT